MKAVADNDVLLKGACYGMLPTWVATVPGDGRVGILGASRFVVIKKIKKTTLRGDPAIAQTRFMAFLMENEVVEPSSEEQKVAALFEAEAQKMALNLDVGESQLVAVLISRSVPWLLTGDKRAITSIDNLFDTNHMLANVAGKVLCLEQLMRKVLTSGDVEQVRVAICAEPFVDKTLSICFSCSSPDANVLSIMAGLASYIADLRSNAARVLAT